MENKSFDALVFDWSGVIADTFNNWYKAAMGVFDAYGANRISREEARREFKQPYMAFYNKYLPDLLLEDQQRTYKELIIQQPLPPLFPGIQKLLTDFHKRGLPLFLISGDSEATLTQELASYGLGDHSKKIVWEAYDKTQALRIIVRDFKLDTNRTLFVGDSTDEILSGKLVGCKTCAVLWGFQSQETLARAGPDYIAKDINELKKLL